MKYLKWVFKDNIMNSNEKFKINEVTECKNWDPENPDWDKRGGFNFTNEECAIRWMSRGDTLYEVEIPENAEVKVLNSTKTPNGIIIANKIILKNPVLISNELLEEYYKKSNIPLNTYFECIGKLASRGYKDLAIKIIKDKVNLGNIEEAYNEFVSTIKPWNEINEDSYKYVKEILEEIKDDKKINLFIDKDPLIKDITNDNIINLTGQSGSGKSTYARENYNNDNYIITDTDEILSENRFINSSGINKEIGIYLRKKYKELPNLSDDFDLIYNEIISYCKDYNKTIVIDSAQFHCVKDIKILKGKLIVLRTSITTCYERCINRYKKTINYIEEELKIYAERKKKIYKWYKYTNEFIEKIG